MQSFIVLGIVPGTNLQLTFNFWLDLTALLLCARTLQAIWRQRSALRRRIAAHLIARTIRTNLKTATL